jgi:hypothetical protein
VATVKAVYVAIRMLERKCSVITLACKREKRNMTTAEFLSHQKMCDALYELWRMDAHKGTAGENPLGGFLRQAQRSTQGEGK